MRDVMLVDSPGMIDSPMVSMEHEMGGEQYSGVATSARPRDRGYNFPGVVRWFAERADVILLFFDPDKPGTTGETLGVMKASLAGLEHKTHYVLNKADQFTRSQDFARAYGSLCWNLSKVIPRKDLPMIYTTCVPSGARADPAAFREEQPAAAAAAAAAGGGQLATTASMSMWEANSDLTASRHCLVGEVRRAPARQVDNMISRLYDSARLLRMHAAMAEAVRREAAQLWFRWTALGTLVAATGASVAGAAAVAGLVEVAAPAAVFTAAGAAAVAYFGSKALEQQARALLDGDMRGLEDIFRREHFRALAEKDDFVLSLWERARPQLRIAIRTFGARNLPRVPRATLADLDRVVDETVPALRRKASKAAAFLEQEIDKDYSRAS